MPVKKERDEAAFNPSNPRMRDLKNWLVGVGFLALIGCAGTRSISHSAAKTAGEFRRLDGEGTENFYALSATVFSGSAPEGEAGFATLQRLGVKTLISVDGSAPQARLAAKHGLRYVHVPVGYDGIAPSTSLVIIKAAQTLPGPIFVHCHHGLHRGAAAAAIVCEGLEGWTPQQAEAWLRTAGTATNYAGLYRSVREFNRPTESELRRVPRMFTSRARTPDLVNTMVQIDEHFDALKALQKQGFKPLPEHPDASPANESLILYELFREARRAKLGSERGVEFLLEFAKAETAAGELQSRLKELEASGAFGLQAAETAFQNLAKNCAGCHKSYRN